MIGAVYCPLSPQDPENRLHSLVQQTQSRLVLVHPLTTSKFNDDINCVDIDKVLHDDNLKKNLDVDHLSSIKITPENIAYIIFTSGSTGRPKAVCIRNFVNMLRLI